MSRNSKGAKRNAAAKEMSKTRVAGGHGPSSTTPQHGKKNAWWQKFPSYAAYILGGKKGGQRKQDEATGPAVAA